MLYLILAQSVVKEIAITHWLDEPLDDWYYFGIQPSDIKEAARGTKFVGILIYFHIALIQ